MDATTKLERKLTFKDVIILAFSTMIGWGWVTLTGDWVVQAGGIGATFAFVLGAILCILVGFTYCELTPMLPYTGGELVFAYKALGYHASWFTGWMIAFAYVGVASWEGPALATAVDYLVPLPKWGYLWTIAGFDVYISWLLVPTVVGIGLIYINYKGIMVSAIFQMVVTLILALGGVFFAIVSVIRGDVENIQPLITGSGGVMTVVLAVPAMFVGFDVIPQATEEMNLPVKKIPKAIIASICLAATWYIVMILSAMFAAPKEILAEEVSVVNAIIYATGSKWTGLLIIITAIMGIMSSWNGFIIGATRVLFSMGRAHMLPEIFGRLHSRHKTPWFSTLIIGLITICTPLLGKNSLSWFVNSSAFGTVIAYFMVCLSFVILRKKNPDYPRPYKVKHGLLIGILAILISIFFILLYLPIGPSSLSVVEWIIFFVWFGSGVIIYIWSLFGKKENENKRNTALFDRTEGELEE